MPILNSRLAVNLDFNSRQETQNYLGGTWIQNMLVVGWEKLYVDSFLSGSKWQGLVDSCFRLYRTFWNVYTVSKRRRKRKETCRRGPSRGRGQGQASWIYLKLVEFRDPVSSIMNLSFQWYRAFSSSDTQNFSDD